MNTSSSPRGWHSRGYLPHFDGGESLQFLTLRLADSVPDKVIEKWKTRIQFESEDLAKELLMDRIDKYIDQGFGECYLKQRAIAQLVQHSLQKFDGDRYDLFSWVIMPNHTHFILRPRVGWNLSSIIKSHKSYTGRMSNRHLDRSGRFWQEDYFDREIRDQEDFFDKIQYIEMNPVKAKLCKNPQEWEFGSANYESRFF
ncbi:MAG: transposase [Acidobacteriota bacterium]|nr:transposase [Acidobacteriota bacterium]MDH3530359.1 transposase [Acidobacteriota bacterium]